MWERACSRVSRPLPARNRRFSAAGSVAQSWRAHGPPTEAGHRWGRNAAPARRL